MTTFDHVRARFGGRDITFKIDRNHLAVFEHLAGKSAISVLKALSAGHWTQHELAIVLKLAAVSSAEIDRILKPLGGDHRMLRTMISEVSIFTGLHCRPATLDPRPEVAHVLATLGRGPANYVALAAAVLGAALFGITAEEGVFSDEMAEAAA